MNAELLAERRKGIGGSEASAALGLSRYKSPFQLYLEKIGEIDQESEKAVMTRGKLFEPVLREMYSELTGRKVSEFYEPVKSDVVPFMFVTPDGLADENRYLEIKTARNRHEFGEPGTDEIPQEYLIQVQHGLFVTRLQVADVFVAFSLDDIKLYEVREDKELQDMIIAGERDFWNHVETRNPPKLETYEDVSIRYRRSSGKAIMASDKIEAMINELREVKTGLKTYKEPESMIKTEIMKFMGEHDSIIGSDGRLLATWKETKPKSIFDEDGFKGAHPELWAQFQKQGNTQRRFLLK